MENTTLLPWISDNSYHAMEILKDARNTGRPVILLTGAGTSVDSGFPLAQELKEYFVQVRHHVLQEGFTNIRQYIEETRWPSRHDLRVDLMFKTARRKNAQMELSLSKEMDEAERAATQAALVAELRGYAPSLAASLHEIFEQKDTQSRRREELAGLYEKVLPLAECLGRRSPGNIAYRSLLANLCDNTRTTIDACFDHFIRDRMPTTTHQFIYFLTKALRTQVIFTTNFDPLLETAFEGEGLRARVYEVHGEESIPSARLLLSQPLSIVKLHGGSHQLQTGFDLDDPLSPSALAAFAELYEMLYKQHGAPPLTVVLGYSGSDRRVMDIIAAQIRAWKGGGKGSKTSPIGRPSVLWVARDLHPPVLLDAAVSTHPDIIQHELLAVGKRPLSGASQYPAHMVRCRDGRLFLLESLQTILEHFPIAKSYYQSVNFVPHSVSGKERVSENAKFFKGDWRIALIHTLDGGGSSSTLVNISEELERNAGCRTIWIDLAEVPGVPALIDLISERITKLDTRLQPVRRPPMLRSLLWDDSMQETNFSKAGRKHELKTCVQWLRSALRRGKYLLALDSLDEFPGGHPAGDIHQAGGAGREDRFKDEKRSQQSTMAELIEALTEHSGLIGDSRIALAFSSGRGRSSERGHAEDSALDRLASFLRGLNQSEGLIRAPDLATKDHGTPKGRPALNTLQVRQTKDRPRKNSELQSEIDPDEFLHRAFIIRIILLISCCCRRVRSEVILVRCVGEYIGRLVSNPNSQTGNDAPKREELLLEGVKTVLGTPEKVSQEGIFAKALNDVGVFQRGLDYLWDATRKPRQHLTYRSIAELVPLIRECVHDLSRHGEVFSVEFAHKETEEVCQLIYRTEGGYHWMHHELRDTLYTDFLKVEGSAAMAMAHHVMALFCYDELYERSRDARAFLEYLFHRVASIRRAIDGGENRIYQALGWVNRLMISLHREKHALMTRVRLPAFLDQLTQLRLVLDRLQRKIDDEILARSMTRSWPRGREILPFSRRMFPRRMFPASAPRQWRIFSSFPRSFFSRAGIPIRPSPIA